MKPAIRLIKTQEDYESALARVDALMKAVPGTPEGDELELLAALIAMYEEKAFPIGLPSVAEAIKFRMEQMEMKAKDLIPYLGSAARVSEILAGKRPLTLKMVRALHKGLGIPAEALLHSEGADLPEEEPGLDWSRFPIPAMVKAGYFPGFSGTVREARDAAEDLVRALLRRACPGGLHPAFLRQRTRQGAEMDLYALTAWQARVMDLAQSTPVPASYRPGTVTEEFIRDVVRLSYLDEGPRMVRDFLGKSGIHFVVLPHLPRTHLDGAALWAGTGNPVVALTLRHDRLDNFWFCLAHELAHVGLHLENDRSAPIFDDLDLRGESLDVIEQEADALALQALIDERTWRSSPACETGDPQEIRALAKRLRIHPAIVAGRYRHETSDYRALTRLIGQGEVRKQFQEIKALC